MGSRQRTGRRMSDLADFVAAIEAKTGRAGRKIGKEIRLLCPAHDDHNPSLDVREGNNGPPVCTCRSHGCTYEQICEAIGYTPQGNGNGGRQIGAVFTYLDEAGEPLSRLCGSNRRTSASDDSTFRPGHGQGRVRVETRRHPAGRLPVAPAAHRGRSRGNRVRCRRGKAR